jgi:cytoskeleton protein RodZ
MSSPQAPEMLLTQEDTSDSPSAAPTAGQLLKSARQAKGVHLAVLAVTLKVPVRQLEALEADQYDAFKGGTTFLRAITSAMCRHLGIDAAPVLALLPSAVSSMGAARPALEPLSGLQRVSMRPRAVQRSARPVLILALLMLLGTAAFLWLPSPDVWWPGVSSNASSATQAEEAAVPLGQASNPESSEEAASAASSALPMASPAASAPAAPASSVPMAAGVSTAAAVLRLEAMADTWVEVRDAKGPVLSKLLKSAESLDIQHPVPYSVVIGRAAAVKATLRGQPFDLKPYAPQSVARFEVKE